MRVTVRHILLVEDNPHDAELTLTELGKHVSPDLIEHVRDGAQALDWLRQTGEYAGRATGWPLVVLLDLKLPKVSGLEVLREIKEAPGLRATPVVVLTSSREDQDVIEAYRLGVNAYVVKPVGFPEFVRAIRTLGLFWAILNEPSPGAAPGDARPVPDGR